MNEESVFSSEDNNDVEKLNVLCELGGRLVVVDTNTGKVFPVTYRGSWHE
jgi:hypothetical protein